MSKYKFKEGFDYKGFSFGWYNNQLFRLPNESNGRYYGLKSVPLIKLSKSGKGYRLVRDKKSLGQVKSMTTKFKAIKVVSFCSECEED